MEYPHKRYILYLLSRQMNGMEISAECLSKDLLPPEPRDLSNLKVELGGIPLFWKAQVTRENLRFRRWLRDTSLLVLWVQDATTERAFSFLHKKAVRHDFEAVLLAHGNVEQARGELIVKYPESLVPSVKVLERFQELFWNTGEMTPQGIFDYIEECQGREAYLPALQGDLVRAYGELGLQQRVRGEVFLQTVVDAAYQQALRLRKNPNASGALLAGMSSMIKTGIEAQNHLEDKHLVAEGDTGMRKDAADFVARVIQGDAVPSIDEVTQDVIDAEYVEAGEENVHRLTVRRK